MKRNTLCSLILAIEAVLIIIALASGRTALVSMACYWAVVALNHLTDFIIRWIEEREEEKDAGKHSH